MNIAFICFTLSGNLSIRAKADIVDGLEKELSWAERGQGPEGKEFAAVELTAALKAIDEGQYNIAQRRIKGPGHAVPFL